MIDLADQKQPATLIAELVVKTRRELVEGFPVFAKRSTRRPFAFIVEEVVTPVPDADHA